MYYGRRNSTVGHMGAAFTAVGLHSRNSTVGQMGAAFGDSCGGRGGRRGDGNGGGAGTIIGQACLTPELIRAVAWTDPAKGICDAACLNTVLPANLTDISMLISYGCGSGGPMALGSVPRLASQCLASPRLATR